jgi:hypothetical protein
MALRTVLGLRLRLVRCPRAAERRRGARPKGTVAQGRQDVAFQVGCVVAYDARLVDAPVGAAGEMRRAGARRAALEARAATSAQRQDS